ncbi:hypothetical protein ABZ635_16265 [Nocardiopsis sp. NPDC007018]|uniref:variant leucine-rich repeat-containing protein n=1 Tax=Nocardiopsis sp. NPDC007018 TaxID=3155721 RepID=UPI003411CBEF
MNPPGQRDPASYSAQELADPRVDATTLRHVAAARPDLWQSILNHPNCDAELAAYLRQNSRPATPPPGGHPQGPPHAQGPQTHPGAAPQQGPPPQYGPQPPAGPPPQGAPQTEGQPSQASQGAQQMAAGAKDLANGAKAYFTNTVAPAAVSAAQTVSQRSGQASGTLHWSIWCRFAIPALALVGIISLLLPLGSVSYGGRTEHFNYFSPDAPGEEGVLMLTFYIFVIVFGVVSLLTGQRWALITVAVMGIVTGVFGMLNGFGNASRISSEAYASAGFGAILLGISGLALIVAAVITLLPQQKLGAPAPPPQG